jgi:serine/threonine protein kinase
MSFLGAELLSRFRVERILAERVARSPLDTHEAASLGANLAEVLAYLHSRIPPVVHRDLKPSNLVLRDDGAVSLIDFGAVTNPARTGDLGSTIVGTYGYIAPDLRLREGREHHLRRGGARFRRLPRSLAVLVSIAGRAKPKPEGRVDRPT